MVHSKHFYFDFVNIFNLLVIYIYQQSKQKFQSQLGKYEILLKVGVNCGQHSNYMFECFFTLFLNIVTFFYII